MGERLGMLVDGAVMVVISVCYAYLMRYCPYAGGAYAFTRDILGYDFCFLTAWFLSLTYLAILWANVTSIPLFAQYLWGDFFRVGKLYTLFGYDVYLGEGLLSVGVLVVVAILCAVNKRLMTRFTIGMSLLFTAGIVTCFAVAIVRHGGDFRPRYVPDASHLSQVVRIAVISPWAFIGFESISHATEEMNFKLTTIFRVLLISVITTTLLYIFLTLLSATAWPSEYRSWLQYIHDRGNLTGLKALPAFYAAEYYLGESGVFILMLTLLCLILTSLIGHIYAISRLFFALGRDGVIPRRYGRVNKQNIPSRAIGLIIAASAFFPFLGRTTIGWIVDVTTIGATLIYGLVSVSAMKLARKRGDRLERVMGMIGVAIMIGFGIYLVVPNLYTESSMAVESYFLFIVWAMLGFVYFRVLLTHDASQRFGNSVVVWISLFSLILFISLIYLVQSIMNTIGAGMTYIERFYTRPGVTGIQPEVVSHQLSKVRRVSGNDITVTIMLIMFSLGMLIANFRMIIRRTQGGGDQFRALEEAANRDPLTGVRSQYAFAARERELDERIADGSANPFGLVVCDLNGLRRVNEVLGRKAGDACIRRACQMICDEFAHSPVYRTGGDEFAVYITGRDFEAREAIMDALHKQSVSLAQHGDVAVAAGMVAFERDRDGSIASVLARAESAMLDDKALLRNAEPAT